MAEFERLRARQTVRFQSRAEILGMRRRSRGQEFNVQLEQSAFL
jgi:hypothetical protein